MVKLIKFKMAIFFKVALILSILFLSSCKGLKEGLKTIVIILEQTEIQPVNCKTFYIKDIFIESDRELSILYAPIHLYFLDDLIMGTKKGCLELYELDEKCNFQFLINKFFATEEYNIENINFDGQEFPIGYASKLSNDFFYDEKRNSIAYIFMVNENFSILNAECENMKFTNENRFNGFHNDFKVQPLERPILIPCRINKFEKYNKNYYRNYKIKNDTVPKVLVSSWEIR